MRCPKAEALVAAQDWDGLEAHFKTCPVCQQGLNNLAEAVVEMDALAELEQAWADFRRAEEAPQEDDQS